MVADDPLTNVADVGDSDGLQQLPADHGADRAGCDVADAEGAGGRDPECEDERGRVQRDRCGLQQHPSDEAEPAEGAGADTGQDRHR